MNKETTTNLPLAVFLQQSRIYVLTHHQYKMEALQHIILHRHDLFKQQMDYSHQIIKKRSTYTTTCTGNITTPTVKISSTKYSDSS